MLDHVRFGLHWLRELKPADQSEWDAYCSHLRWPLRPAKACGDTFQEAPRLAAGMTGEFVAALREALNEESSNDA